MPKNQGLKDYKEMSILSAKPERLILMLYDGALRFLRQAIKGLEEKNLEFAHHNMIRTQNILTELIASLNFDKGGEIALNLFRIYEFMHYTLVQANVKKDPEPARKIYEQIKTLRNSWERKIQLPIHDWQRIHIRLRRLDGLAQRGRGRDGGGIHGRHLCRM